MRKADPVLLEPIMKVCVIVPDEYMGDVIGDLNARRGQIQGYEMRSGAQQIDAFVPLSEMFGYATEPALPHAGPWSVHHGAQPLCGAAEEPAGEAHRQAHRP